MGSITNSFAERLNFEVSWKRVKNDKCDGHCFITNPYDVVLIESDALNWLESLRNRINTNAYNPNRCDIVDSPKPNWHIRPGAILSIEDNVVYSALILDIIENIKNCISWSSNSIRFSYILKDDQTDSKWFEFEMNGWLKFGEESKKLIDSGYHYVLFADISAFYENIDIQRLLSDLKSLKVPSDTLRLLNTCLNRWAEPRGRGIPQGFRPSAILSELYLDAIDRRLHHKDVVHLRYNDDIRIFCKTKEDAIRSLHLLTRLLREKCLNLQTSKTFIKYKEDAINEISLNSTQIIAELNVNLGNELKNLGLENPYTTPSELTYLTDVKKTEIKAETLKESFDKRFISKDYSFDKSLFHFILNRLRALKDDYAAEYCTETILEKPEETRYILSYFSALPIKKDLAEKLAEFLKKGLILSEYQKFMIVRWFWEMKIESSSIISVIRNLLDTTEFQFIRDYCIAYLGKCGDSADLDLIESYYTKTSDIVSRAVIICGLKRMEVNRRNSIYGRAERDGIFVNLAIKWVRSN